MDANSFPHRSKVMHPVNEFHIDGRVLSLYTVDGRTPSAPFSLYWNDETNPVQHAMTCFEVFTVLAQVINKET